MTTDTDTTNLRNKLATTSVQRTELAPTDPNEMPLEVAVRNAIANQSSAFRQILPDHVDPDRFSRLVLAAVKATPKLVECFGTQQGQMSVLLAAMQSASLGLEPNTPTQEAWLLPRSRKDGSTWVTECQLSIGYRGWMKLARQSGVIETMYAQEVREHDHFVWSRGLEKDHLEFTEASGDRGDLVAAFAVARFKAGGYSFIVQSRDQVEARRAMSDSWKNERSRPFSPWTNWPEAMWRKSAIRALVPYLDLSPEMAQASVVDERPLRIDHFGQLGPAPDEHEALPPADVPVVEPVAEPIEVKAEPVVAPNGMHVPEAGELEQLIEQAGVTQSKAVMEGRRLAKKANVDQPTSLPEFAGTQAGALLYANLMVKIGGETKAQPIETTATDAPATEAPMTDISDFTRRKLFAMAAEAWKDEEDQRMFMLGLAEMLTGVKLESRTEITEALGGDMIAALDGMKRSGQELHRKASGEWDLRSKPQSNDDEEPF